GSAAAGVIASEDGRARGNVFEAAFVRVTAFLTGETPGGTGHCASCATRPCEWLSLQDERGTDPGAHGHIQKRTDVSARAKASLRECRCAHVGFDHRRRTG